MEGQILASSLVALKGTDLRMVYALFLKTNMGHLLSLKAKDVVSKLSKEESDTFTDHLKKEVNKLTHVEDQVLQVDLFLEITQVLKLKGTNYSSEQEIVDQSANIVKDVYEQLFIQDKHFKRFAEKESQASHLQQIIQFQMSKLFSELDVSFKDFSIEDQRKLASMVNEYIQSLPEEKQSEIKKKLGILDLTDEGIHRAFATSGLSMVFAIIADVSGFAFYSRATSLIAVLADPLFFVPVLLGGGASLKKKLMPIVIMQIALPFICQESDDISFELFTAEWNRRFNEYGKLQIKLNNENEDELKLLKNIADTKEQISDIHSSILQEEQHIRAKKEQIYHALKSSHLEDLEINEAFQKNRMEYRNIQDHIHALQQMKKVDAVNDSFFRRIGNKFSNLAKTLDIKNEERKLDKYLYIMVENVIYSSSSFQQAERESIQSSTIKLKELRQMKDEKTQSKIKLEALLKQVNQNQSRIKQDMKAMEKQNYGIDHVRGPAQPLLLNEHNE